MSLKILIADPNEDFRLQLRDLFTTVVFPGRSDITIDQTPDARAAFALVHADRPRLLVASVKLEGGNGLALTKKIKTIRALKNTKVLLLSDRVFDDAAAPYQVHAKWVEADDFMLKPVNSAQFKSSVLNLLPGVSQEKGLILPAVLR